MGYHWFVKIRPLSHDDGREIDIISRFGKVIAAHIYEPKNDRVMCLSPRQLDFYLKAHEED